MSAITPMVTFILAAGGKMFERYTLESYSPLKYKFSDFLPEIVFCYANYEGAWPIFFVGAQAEAEKFIARSANSRLDSVIFSPGFDTTEITKFLAEPQYWREFVKYKKALEQIP